MATPPVTVLDVSAEEEAAIRSAVRTAERPFSRLATGDDAAALLELLSDPRVSDPIYDLPRPFTLQSVSAWIEDALAARERGEGLLFLNTEPDGAVSGYSRFTVWPGRSAAEIAGAKAASRQNSGQETRAGGGAANSFGWMFETLGVRLVCLTAALDNIRSIKLIDAAGFRRCGEREVVRPDGTTRRSHYWELTRDEWRALHGRPAA